MALDSEVYRSPQGQLHPHFITPYVHVWSRIKQSVLSVRSFFY